jgi:hypothetical protein
MRADEAFAAGRLEDARAATDEAKELDPEWPPVAAMEGRLAEAVSLPELMLRTDPVEVDAGAEHEKERHGLGLTAALAFASVALVTIGSLGYKAGLDPIGLAPGSFRGDVTLAADPVVDAELGPPPPALAVGEPVALPTAEMVAVQTSGMAEPAVAEPSTLDNAPVDMASTATARAVPPVAPAYDTRGSRPSVIPPPPLSDASTRSADDDPVASPKLPAAEASVSPPAVEAAPLSAALPSSSSIPVSAPPAFTPEPAPASKPLTPEAIAAVDARSAVRATLARYEAAYSGLNVSAARAVWPGVDERALAKAFDGLSSQRVALERCDVAVTDATATASCSGRAEWTPKVGGGQRRQNRRWTFELVNAGGSWQIVSAETK